MSESSEWAPACDSGSDFHGGIVGCDSGSDFHGGIVGVGGIVQWVIVGKDGRIVNDGIVVNDGIIVEGKVVVYSSSATGRHTIPFYDESVERFLALPWGTGAVCMQRR